MGLTTKSQQKALVKLTTLQKQWLLRSLPRKSTPT